MLDTRWTYVESIALLFFCRILASPVFFVKYYVVFASSLFFLCKISCCFCTLVTNLRFFSSIFCCSNIFVTIWESRLQVYWFHFLEFPHMSNLQIKSERKPKLRDDARIKISSPAGFQYWQMSQNTSSSYFFTTLLHIFHRIFSYSGCFPS